MLVASATVLLIADSTPRSFLYGLPLVIIGEMIRMWSAGYLNKMSKLTTAGPFAICRNPLYVGSFFISLGYVVMCHRPWLVAPAVVLFWLFHGGAVAHEEKMLVEKFGEDFTTYCKSVPRFISFPRSLKGYGKFSFLQMIHNREHINIIGTIITSSVFAVMSFTDSPVPINWLLSFIR
ncbi:MAG: isoprenylcysteine carboxylmethyltransferase family protein [Armatimonadota bacterium]|nr:isoprenylcysteine carboxylmethyltransferase family protein [bacterium]